MKSDALHTLMRNRADLDKLEPGHLMRRHADELEAAIDRAYATDGTSQDACKLLGSWARARHYWSEYTGEPLI